MELNDDVPYDDIKVDLNCAILEKLEEEGQIITWKWKEK